MVVTLGAIASVGAIAIWQTRQVLSSERLERAARMADLAGRLLDEATGAERANDPATHARLVKLLPSLRSALDADNLALLDGRGDPVTPGPRYETDARGAAAARAGAPPHAEHVPSRSDLVLVAYAHIGEGVVVRSVFEVDHALDAVLGRATTSVVLLGAVDGLILLVVAAWILRGAVVRPVAGLERAAQRVAAGDLDARVDVRGPGELGRLADAFDSMTASIKAGRESLVRSERLAGVGRLAAGIAHEVGNPLAAILGYADVLLSETDARPLPPELRRDVLERVRAETERIHHIIQELLDYARPPRDEVEEVSVERAVDAARSLVRAQARTRGVTIELNLPAALPPVRASAGRLTQVILNLMLNAADATRGAGKVTIDARVDGDRVIIGVADDGPGVPADVAARIFDPFFTTKDVGRGTGLGLSVSQAIIEGYGGTLRLATTERGARFEIVLVQSPAVGRA